MRLALAVGLLAVVPSAAPAQAIRIRGETRYPSHSLVRLRAEHVDAKAALLWRVYPSTDVQRATSPRGLLEFAAPPGTYEVELLVITNTDGTLSVEEARVRVTIEPCPPTPPPPEPKPEPKPPEGGKPDPVHALGLTVGDIALTPSRSRCNLRDLSPGPISAKILLDMGCGGVILLGGVFVPPGF